MELGITYGWNISYKRIHLFCNYKNWCKKYKSNSNSTENMGPCLKLIPTKYVTVKRVKREAYCHNGAKKLHKIQCKRTFIALWFFWKDQEDCRSLNDSDFLHLVQARINNCYLETSINGVWQFLMTYNQIIFNWKLSDTIYGCLKLLE